MQNQISNLIFLLPVQHLTALLRLLESGREDFLPLIAYLGEESHHASQVSKTHRTDKKIAS